MYIRNRYLCHNCGLAENRKDNEVIKTTNCSNCNSPTEWLAAIEFDDNDLMVREYCLSGKIIEHEKPHKLEPTSMPKPKPTVTCPYCNSTNCKKLGAISRGVSFGLFGFGSGKIGKQWHCNDCKSDF